MMKVLLENLVNVKTGKLDANQADVNGKYPFFTCSKEISKINSYSYDCECVLIAGNGDLNVKYYNGKFDAYQRTYILTSIDNNTLSNKYLYWFMNRYIVQLRNQSIGGVIKYIKLGDLTNISLNLPRLDVQKRIVRIFEAIESLIDKQLIILQFLDNLIKSRFVEMFGDITERGRFKVKRWKDVLDIFNGKDYKNVLINKGGYPVYGSGGIIARANDYICPAGTIIIGRKGSINNPILVNEKFWNVDTAFGIVAKEVININYLFYFCKQYNFNRLNKATTLPSLTKRDLLEIEINIPDLEEQIKFSRFVNQINKLKSDVQKSIDETQLLMDSLMQEYFG